MYVSSLLDAQCNGREYVVEVSIETSMMQLTLRSLRYQMYYYLMLCHSFPYLPGCLYVHIPSRHIPIFLIKVIYTKYFRKYVEKKIVQDRHNKGSSNRVLFSYKHAIDSQWPCCKIYQSRFIIPCVLKKFLTVLWNMGPLKVLNDIKLILGDQEGDIDSFRINSESFRTFRVPIFHKAATGQESFLDARYNNYRYHLRFFQQLPHQTLG